MLPGSISKTGFRDSGHYLDSISESPSDLYGGMKLVFNYDIIIINSYVNILYDSFQNYEVTTHFVFLFKQVDIPISQHNITLFKYKMYYFTFYVNYNFQFAYYM